MSNLIVVDGNLFFNNALKNDLSYNDTIYNRTKLNQHHVNKSPMRVPIERINATQSKQSNYHHEE